MSFAWQPRADWGRRYHRTEEEPRMSRISRINIEVDKSVVATLDELQDLSPTSTRKGLVIAALRMYLWALRERSRNRVILAVDDPQDISAVSEFHDNMAVKHRVPAMSSVEGD